MHRRSSSVEHEGDSSDRSTRAKPRRTVSLDRERDRSTTRTGRSILTDDDQLIISTVGSEIRRETCLVHRFREIGVVPIDRRLELEKSKGRSSDCPRADPYLFADDIREERRRLRGFGFRRFRVVDQRDEKRIEVLSFLEHRPTHHSP